MRVCGKLGRVIANAPICREHSEIELIVAEFPVSHPGQFLQLQCRESIGRAPRSVAWEEGGFPSLSGNRGLGRCEAYLRRPFSIANHRQDGAGHHLTIISRKVGPGTTWLEQLAPGDHVSVTGPLGHGFEIPQSETPLLLVGGGVGIPPTLYLARRLDELGRREVTAFFGATSRDLLPLRLAEEPATDGTPATCAELAGAARYPTAITTDDGSCGMQGVVTDALRRWHSREVDGARASALVFACGPDRMLSAVAGLTRELGLGCQLCIERHMGCGLGTCLSCVVRVRDASESKGWRWAQACEEGPVFDRDQLNM